MISYNVNISYYMVHGSDSLYKNDCKHKIVVKIENKFEKVPILATLYQSIMYSIYSV